MRYKIFVIFCTIACHAMAIANINPKDSLLQLLPKTSQPEERLYIYRNLGDLSFETPAEKTYLKDAYKEALKAGNNEESIEILGELCFSFIKENETDSADNYLNKIRKGKQCNLSLCWATYLNMRLFDRRIIREDNKEVIEKELQNKGKNKHSNIYSKIESAYIVGSALSENKKLKEALPYIETAYNLALQLPLNEGYNLQYITLRRLGRNYNMLRNNAKAKEYAEKLLVLHSEYFEKYKKEKRPFYYINSHYITAYTSLLLNAITGEPEKVDYYADKITELYSKVSNSIDKYSCLLSLYNYQLSKRNLKVAIAINDSLIRYAREIAPENLSGLYKISSTLYEMTFKYKESLKALKTSYSIQDSFNTLKAQDQLNQLQVKYGVDKLNYEKSQLEIKNKRILLITISCTLIISILISIQLYRNLKKEQMMKAELRLLKNKAEESEKMKTAFINSICHEIRTPLNSIVGFTDLIFDTSIDEEIRSSFPEEIQSNTKLLTSLINSMLEVSNLDVSEEKLPAEPVDLSSVCERGMDQLREYGKSEIDFRLDIPEDTITISTNERYLSLMLESLLNNANKFTETGHIVLHYHVNNNNLVEIHVTDTGCGIPLEKHDEVFERFTKLDTYKQGNGLGLYLCRLIVQRLSGEIYIEPSYTEGTQFIITLPINNG